MIDLKRNRFWLWLTGILVVLIGAATWLFISRLPLHRLRSGDVLIYDQEKMWLLDPSDYTLSLLLEPAREGFKFGVSVRVSPKHDYMYLIAYDTVGQEMLLRYDLRNGDLQAITRFPLPAQISSIFPDGTRVIVVMYPPEPGTRRTCVLELQTGDCLPVGREEETFLRDGLWISRDMMLTTSIDRGIRLLSFKENQFSLEKTILRPGISFYQADSMSDCCVVLAAYQQEEQKEGKPVLLSLDRDSFELAELPIVPTNYRAAFNDISVSSNAGYVAYGQGLNFEVKEVSSGKTVAALYDVLYSAWIRDTDSIVMFVEHSDYQGEPDELLVMDASTGQTQTILTLDQQVWFERVP